MEEYFHGLLVSSGFSAPVIREKVAAFAREHGYVKAHIVTTARPEKEDAPWNKVTKQQLEEMGMTVSFVDFDADESLDDDVDLIYVCGGNTFHLLGSIQKSDAPIREQIIAMCSRGGLYIGSSAGAVIACPHIAAAGEVHPDRNTDGITDLSAFHFVSCHIIPHYTPQLEGEITVFQEKNNISDGMVVRLRDGEGLHSDGERQEILQ